MKQVLIPTCNGTKVVMAGNIIRVQGSSNYSRIFFSNEEPLLVAKVLHWFEDQLPADMFCRIHRGHLINRMYVTEVTGTKSLTLNNGEIIQMSRRKRNSFSTMIKQSA